MTRSLAERPRSEIQRAELSGWIRGLHFAYEELRLLARLKPSVQGGPAEPPKQAGVSGVETHTPSGSVRHIGCQCPARPEKPGGGFAEGLGGPEDATPALAVGGTDKAPSDHGGECGNGQEGGRPQPDPDDLVQRLEEYLRRNALWLKRVTEHGSMDLENRAFLIRAARNFLQREDSECRVLVAQRASELVDRVWGDASFEVALGVARDADLWSQHVPHRRYAEGLVHHPWSLWRLPGVLTLQRWFANRFGPWARPGFSVSAVVVSCVVLYLLRNKVLGPVGRYVRATMTLPVRGAWATGIPQSSGKTYFVQPVECARALASWRGIEQTLGLRSLRLDPLRVCSQ
nr:MAG: hypothetical protein [Sanya tombus-like virus 7]